MLDLLTCGWLCFSLVIVFSLVCGSFVADLLVTCGFVVILVCGVGLGLMLVVWALWIWVCDLLYYVS